MNLNIPIRNEVDRKYKADWNNILRVPFIRIRLDNIRVDQLEICICFYELFIAWRDV